MDERIIIEQGGRRWEVVGNDISIGKWYGSDCLVIGNFTRNIYMLLKPLPPVSQEDSSAGIAKLEAENAKLREAMKPIMEIDTSPVMWPFMRVGKHNVYRAVCDAQKIMRGETK